MNRTAFLASALGLMVATGAWGEKLDTSPYPFSCEVTFSGYEGASTLENFPALVRIPAGSDVYCGSLNGSDIRFADADGNLVPHEINSWNQGGESLVWVRVPVLSGKATKLKMYFGAANDQRADPGEVWAPAEYRGVWHFEGSNADSSTNHLVCLDKSWPVDQPKPTYTKPMALGAGFDSTGNGYVVVSNDARWAAFPTNTLTVSAWIKYGGSASDDLTPRLISSKLVYNDANGFELHKAATKDTPPVMTINTISSGAGQKSVATPDYSASPVYFTVTFSAGKTSIFVNGEKRLDAATSTTLAPVENNLFFAADRNGSNRPKSAALDEIRLQWAVPSDDWVAADYATQTSTDFAVLGAVERRDEPLDPANFAFRSTITFSGYTGSETLFNFPALVRMPASSGLAMVAGADGLRFADADGYLIPHEVEVWNPHGETLVWVRVPKLAGRMTTVTVYAGMKTSVAALAPSSVWAGADYRGVWHLNGSHKDSSPNNFAATDSSGFSYVRDGKIGGGYRSTGGGLITLDYDARWADGPRGALTVSAWIKSTSSNTARIISSKPGNYYDDTGFEFTIQNATNRLNAIASGSNQNILTIGDGLEFKSDLVYATAVYKDGNSSIYANGVLQGATTDGKQWVNPPSGTLTFARGWAGDLDEIRLQWRSQSADWVKADYDTQNPDGAFAVFGAVEDLDAVTLDPECYCRRATVTFSGYTGASALANFPALVRIPAGSPLYVGSKSDGSDLRFTDATNRIVPHEIEAWNKSGESLVWVRVPRLEGNATALNVYFKPVRGVTVPAARSFREVWGGAGYKGVWHFAGSVADSSPKALAATAHNVQYEVYGPLGQAFKSAGGSSGGYLDVADLGMWSDFNGSAFTVSAWIHNTVKADGYFDRIVSTKTADTEVAGFEVTRQKFTYKLNANGNRSGNYQHAVEIQPYDMYDETIYATFVFADGYYDMFVNGQRVGTPLTASALATPVKALTIGGAPGTTNNRWHGQIDEVRLQGVAQSDDWVKADYDTQKAGASFATIGEVERLKDVGAVLIFR